LDTKEFNEIMPYHNNSNTDLRSEQVQELLEAVPNWMIRYGNTLIFVLIGLFLALSWIIKYPDVLPSEALITTVTPPQKEYAKVSAKIDTILVADGKIVSANAPLAILENTANYKDIYLLKSVIDTITVNKELFNFPIEKMPLLFLGDIETDYALFENNYIQYQLNKKLNPFSNEDSANKQSLLELNSRLNILKSQKKINKLELEYQKKDLERNKILFDKGVISRQNYEEQEIAYLRSERNYASIDASISQIKQSIGDANRTSRSTIINKTKENISLLKNVLQSYDQLKRAIRNWEMQYVLKSNVEGKVIFLNTWTENQNVVQGDLLFTIIPKNNSAFIAKLKTPSQNSGKIKPGQIVNIRLENYPETEYGTLKGRIESISLLPNSEGFYMTQVSLPDELITSYNKNIDFKYEMKGMAEIITEDLRLAERFFYRIKDIFKT